jgi:lipocalin-like protein
MHCLNKITVAAASLSLLATVTIGHVLAGEQPLRAQLVGTWVLDDLYAVTWDNDDRNPFGPSPRGRMTLDRNGNVIFVIVGADRLKFKLGDRLTGSAEENKGAVQSSQAFFGTYSVREQDKVVVFHVERGSFPNWDGTDQASAMKLSGNELTLTKAGPRSSTSYTTWKRLPEGQMAQER